MQNYEQELAKLTPKESEVSSSEFKSETNQLLPPWLKNAKSDDTDAKSLDKTVVSSVEIELQTHQCSFSYQMARYLVTL